MTGSLLCYASARGRLRLRPSRAFGGAMRGAHADYGAITAVFAFPWRFRRWVRALPPSRTLRGGPCDAVWMRPPSFGQQSARV